MRNEQLNCVICDKCHNNARGLFTHMFGTHGIKKKEAYDRHNNITDSDRKCKFCDNICDFLNVTTGYKSYCCASCATSYYWKTNDTAERRKNASILATERNKNKEFGLGRTKGSKNKQPYPEGVTRNYSQEFLVRISKRFTEMNLNRTDEDWQNIIKSRKFKNTDQTSLTNSYKFWRGCNTTAEALSSLFGIRHEEISRA